MESLAESLAEPQRYSYFEELINNQENPEATILELFAFGNINHYYKYQQQYPQLDEALLNKLIQLTIWERLSENEGSSIAMAAILDDGMTKAVENSQDIESHIINMVDNGIVNVRIDDETQTIQVLDILQVRDVYDEGFYDLKVLKNEDITPILKYRQDLSQWLNTNVQTAYKSYDEEMTRKRKANN